jgi:hypothetical protein
MLRETWYGAPNYRHHFDAYYQEHTAVFSIDPSEMIGGIYPSEKDVWLKHGQSCIRVNFWQTGKGYNQESCPIR